jgi:UrcA family protein
MFVQLPSPAYRHLGQSWLHLLFVLREEGRIDMHSHPNRTLVAIGSALAAALLTASPAIAQDDDEVIIRGVPTDVKVKRVSYRGLNLNLIAHRKILDERVGRAVRDVCDYNIKERLGSDYRLCADHAWAGARPQITQAYVRAAELAYGRR